MARAIFRRVAQRELREAATWYDLICSHPEIFPRVYRHVRCAVVRRFPFPLLYFVADERVTILSVFHSARDPRIWKRRL